MTNWPLTSARDDIAPEYRWFHTLSIAEFSNKSIWPCCCNNRAPCWRATAPRSGRSSLQRWTSKSLKNKREFTRIMMLSNLWLLLNENPCALEALQCKPEGQNWQTKLTHRIGNFYQKLPRQVCQVQPVHILPEPEWCRSKLLVRENLKTYSGSIWSNWSIMWNISSHLSIISS